MKLYILDVVIFHFKERLRMTIIGTMRLAFVNLCNYA